MKWKPVATVEMDPSGPRQAVYLPSDHPGTCRFCRRSPERLAFKKDAHALPELIGNRYFLHAKSVMSAMETRRPLRMTLENI
jgi:hypothetical protein